MNLGTISQSTRRIYIRELKEVLGECMRVRSTRPFRPFLRRWLAKGAPIDPAALQAPGASLAIVIHQLVLAFPTLAQYHADARLWLTTPEARFARTGGKATGNAPFRACQESFIPWNLALYAPKGTPYDAFNSIGFTEEIIDDDAAANTVPSRG